MSETKQLVDLPSSIDVKEGELPEGWELRRFEDVLVLQRGFDLPVQDRVPGPFPVLGSKGTIDSHNEAKVDGPGVVTGRSGTIGQVQYIDGPYWPLNTTLYVRDFRGNLPWFIHYLLQMVPLKQYAGGSTVPSLDRKVLREVELFVPPLEEQERIVEILEDQLSRLDTALQSVQSVREKAAQFRRSLLHAAFTGALTGHDVEEAELPSGWGQSTLGDISEVRYGYTESANNEPIGPRFLRITDIQNGGVEWEDVPYCEISNQNYQKHRLNNGDIVFARTGATTGKSFLVVDPPDAVCASYLIRLRVKVQFVSQEFLGLYFDSDGYWGQIRKGTTGTAQGGFNASKLSVLQIVLPPLEEQERIVEILEDQLSRLDASLAVADAVEDRSTALRRSLLHSAFTGRLTEEWREAVNV